MCLPLPSPGLAQMQGLRMQGPGQQQFLGPRMPSPMMAGGRMPPMLRPPLEGATTSLSELQRFTNMQMMPSNAAMASGQQMTGTPLLRTWLPPGAGQPPPGQLMHRQQPSSVVQSPVSGAVITRPPMVSGAHAQSSATQALIDLKNLQSQPVQMALSHDNGVMVHSAPMNIVKTEVDLRDSACKLLWGVLCHLLFSQILDGALCRAFKVQREFVSPLQVTHLHSVGSFTSPGIYTR